jgi:predicted Zn-dependent peptidase
MNTRKLTLEISESLFEQLEKLAELTEESINDLAIQMIAANILSSTQKASNLNEILAKISSKNLPEFIENGEIVGIEVF